MNLPEVLAVIAEGGSLEREEMRDIMRLVMAGQATGSQLGAFLMGLRMRGEKVSELMGAVDVMRELVRSVPTQAEFLLDTCGTGSSGAKLFNVSTAAVFVFRSSFANWLLPATTESIWSFSKSGVGGLIPPALGASEVFSDTVPPIRKYL